MNNARDVALWAIGLAGDCPSLADVKAGLSLLPPVDVQPNPYPLNSEPANIPGAPGLVYLDGPFLSDHWKHTAYAILEVGESFPEGSPERTFIEAQVRRANANNNMDLQWNACMPLDANGQANGTPFPNTLALPSKAYRASGDFLRTVAEAYAHQSVLADPVTGASFPHP